MMIAKLPRPVTAALLAVLVSSTALAAKSNPKLTHSVNPVYPAALLEKAVAGTAVVKVLVTETGGIGSVELVSADNPEFGASAVEAVKKWTFDPAMEDGKAVAMNVQFPVVFSPPLDKKFNVAMGRDVFRQISEPIIPEDKLDHLLKVVKAPVAYWPQGLEGDPEEVQIAARVVIGPDGMTYNPEASADTPKVLILPTLEAVAKMTFEPPMLDGKPVWAVGEALILFVDAPPPPAN